MKKLSFVCLVTLPILQIVLAALKLFGVFGDGVRWLWVLTPLWLFIFGFALYGMYVSVKQNQSREGGSQSKGAPKDEDGKEE